MELQCHFSSDPMVANAQTETVLHRKAVELIELIMQQSLPDDRQCIQIDM